MSTSLPSAEVAADFKDSLQDLQMNNRYEITNLTIIAKENTEHAMAISRELENHIRTTAPPRKLPALYVLDSVVKNVGSPYTIYLGRNLYSTFMDAYTLVDAPTRKSMEAMLKTWKEPVPGSMEPRPVFSVEVTRAIENALIKARTAAVQHQQLQARTQRQTHALPPRPSVQNQSLYRSTPTPPQHGYGFAPPPVLDSHNLHISGGLAPPGYAQQQVSSHLPATSPGLPAADTQQSLFPLTHQIHPQGTPVNAYHNSYGPSEPDTLNADLERLIAASRDEFAANMYDQAIQQKLKALLDLQTILNSQHLPPDQRQLIKDQVAQLSAASQSHSYQPLPSPTSPYPDLSQLLATVPHRPSTTQPSISTTSLAQLLASVTPRQLTPPPPQPVLPVRINGVLGPPSSGLDTPQLSSSSENPLIAQLRAAGILPTTTDSPRSASAALDQVPESGTAYAPQLPPIPLLPSKTKRIPLVEIPNDVQLNSKSLKIPRPHLIASLYRALPSQCTMCGRRFPASEEGRQRKARHLDWHFQTNQRLQDAAQRGQNRSYYIGEMEWIKFKETDNADEPRNSMNGTGEGTKSDSAASSSRKDPKLLYIKAPSDAASVNNQCPICQEPFETVWHDEAQDWVWMDAIKVGDKIYHASCHSEVNKDQGEPARATPDPSILGKRKAEGNMSLDPRAKMKREAAL